MRKAAILFILFLAVGCRRGDPEPIPAREPAGRVVIAYLCGDNNLSSEIAGKREALAEGMRRAGAVDGRLAVYSDSRDALPALEEITAAGIRTIETMAGINSASPDNLRSILRRITADFPARSYGLICFSHASGWLPQGALNDPAGFAKAGDAATRTIFDDRGDEMPLADFAAAIDVLPGGAKFDFIVFENCYMAGIEVAYELRERTRYIFASSAEMLSDGLAAIYPAYLGLLFEPEPALGAFAEAYFGLWNAKTGAHRSATASVIATGHIEELAAAAAAITEGDPDWAAGIDRGSLQHFNRNPHRLFFDLGQAMETAATPEQAERFAAALSKVVEYEAATPSFMSGYAYSFAIAHHSGLTTYIAQPAYPALNSFHEQTAWHKRLRDPAP